MRPLLVTLNTAIGNLRSAESNLGSVDGSYGWNAAYAKVEATEREYNTALAAVEAALGKEKGMIMTQVTKWVQDLVAKHSGGRVPLEIGKRYTREGRIVQISPEASIWASTACPTFGTGVR